MNRANRIQPVIDLTGEKLASRVRRRDPGDDKVVLNDAGPTILRFFDWRRFAFFDIREIDLMKLRLLGIDRRTRIRTIELALTGGLMGVPSQLEIERRVNRLVAFVEHFMLNRDLIRARCQGVSLTQLDATGCCGER